MRPLQIGRAPEFVGGKARRSRPKSRSRSKRSVRNSQKPQRSHFGDVGFRRIEWCAPNSRTCVRSQQPFGGPKHPKPTHPLQGNTNAPGRSDFKPNAFAAERIHADHSPRRSRPNARPKAGLWTRDKPARWARSAGPCPFYSRDREREHPTHASAWRAAIAGAHRPLWSRRDFSAHILPVSKLTAQYAQILQSRAAKQVCPRRTT